MNLADEARYGRMSLLLLNVCPFTLRHVINDYHTKHGSTSLQDFLDKNKHDIYHFINRRCCCRLIPSRVTPMNRSQWDLLFMKNSSSCRTGFTGDCPCQYDAKPGVTSEVMDITLCCLFIKNICSGYAGINMSHIETIRVIRNQIIHAESARLDVLTFNGYWNKVRFALLDLANNVSPTVHTDTLCMIQDLETRIMNAGDLGEIRKVIVDEKRINVVEENVSGMKKDLDTSHQNIALLEGNVSQLEKNVNQLQGNANYIHGHISELHGSMCHTTEKVTQLEGELSKTAKELTKLGETVNNTTNTAEIAGRKISYLEEAFDHRIKQIKQEVLYSRTRTDNLTVKAADISRLKKRLIKINTNLNKAISLSPLQERGRDELPIELFFVQVLIPEDHTYREKGEKVAEYKREVKDPHDIFVMNDEEVRKVYMLGDAAHGKTTYCIWLVRNWCNAQHFDPKGSKKLDEWGKALKRFDFVFLLQFRHVSQNLSSVIDMICQDVFGDADDSWNTIRYVLSSEKFRSLIIMDGLDEWCPNEETRKQLKCLGIPNFHMSSTVSCFFSMRPWVFSLISKHVKVCDRVIEIHGLSETGIEQVVKNLLLNHYGLKDDLPKFRLKCNKIVQHIEDKSLRSFMQIPMLAVVCIQIWYEGKHVGDSMTSFFAAMLNMLIERAYDRNDHRKGHEKSLDFILPEILFEQDKIKNFIYELLKLGKVAYEGLISHETKLLFQKHKLEKEIGVRELQFALNVGLICQMEAPSLLTKNVSVHFFHKSIQEFLAVIYIATNGEVGDSFCKHLSNVKAIMGLSNVIIFIFGTCPSLGSVVSERVASSIDSDKEICTYRKSPWGGNRIVSELYKLQIRWYNELKSGHTQNLMTDRQVAFHVSDVYIRRYSDKEIVRVTRELLSDHNVAMRSLWLYKVPTEGECGITNTDLNDFLCNKHNNTRFLTMVFINGFKTNRCINTICKPSVSYLYLTDVKINNAQLRSNDRPSLLEHMTSLRVLWLDNLICGDRGLDVSADMIHLETVRLWSVKMSTARWQQFILSLQNIRHRFCVELDNTDIDEECMRKIRSSPNFIVTQDGVGKSGTYELNFFRAWSSSHSTNNDQRK